MQAVSIALRKRSERHRNVDAFLVREEIIIGVDAVLVVVRDVCRDKILASVSLHIDRVINGKANDESLK